MLRQMWHLEAVLTSKMVPVHVCRVLHETGNSRQAFNTYQVTDYLQNYANANKTTILVK
jgi:hypothetical protein